MYSQIANGTSFDSSRFSQARPEFSPRYFATHNMTAKSTRSVMTQCGICGSPNDRFELASVLKKYDVQYFRCSLCGFVQTELPYWLDEAYQSAITSSDIGYVGRNISQAFTTQAMINAFFSAGSRFVDFGGGYGMFVRLLRDSGFDFYRYDQYCSNLFAVGFDITVGGPGTDKFELLTAFEVFEHLHDPAAELTTMLSLSDSILFSTILIPMDPPPLKSWWYYGLEHGQHVSLYTESALSHLAARFGLHLVTDHRGFHLLSKHEMSQRKFAFIIRHRKAAWLINKLHPRKSLFDRDFAAITGGSSDVLDVTAEKSS